MADSFIDALRGFSDTTGGYWSKDNAQFEQSHPTAWGRVLRNINPVTGFGSTIGSMYDAANTGDVDGMALAAFSAMPAFGKLKFAAVPAGPLSKTLTVQQLQQIPSLLATLAGYSKNVGANTAADVYQNAKDKK